MMIVKRLTCLWPGLARLWFRGEWTGLLTACAFAALVNGLVAATLLWSEVAPDPLRWSAWLVASLWWIAAAVLTLRNLREIASATSGDPHQGLFVAAQREYLRGNWIEAEANLRKLLRRAPRDVESLLLLATIFRRTQRHDDARQQLQQLSRLDAARRWQTELRTERELLRRETEQQRLDRIHHDGNPPSNVFGPPTQHIETTAAEAPFNDEKDEREIEPAIKSESSGVARDSQRRAA